MRALVVVESVYGNTRAVAEAVTAGLRPAADIDLVTADEATPERLRGVELLVVGGPTHAHGMSWSSSRHTSDGRAGADGGEPGLRTWFHGIPTSEGAFGAAFDTRFDRHVAVTGSAARGIARRLRHRGYELLDDPTSFFVEDMPGPLAPGELDRARAWGSALAARFNEMRHLAA